MSPTHADVSTFDMVQKLEEFFSSPRFTCAIGDFLAARSSQVEYKSLEEEQPLKNFEIFKDYTHMIEQQLEEFMASNSLAAKDVYEACQSVHTSGQAAWVTCIDYLIASTEYESFMNLMYDYHSMQSYVPDFETEWDPPPEDGVEE